MSPVVDNPKRGIPVIGWCAIACGGCGFLAVAGAIVLGIFMSRTFKSMTKESPVAAATPASSAPFRDVWRYSAVDTLALACAPTAVRGVAPVILLHREGGVGARVVELNAEGRSKGSFPVGATEKALDVGRRGSGLLVLAWTSFGKDVDAYDGSGRHLWTYSQGDGVMAACPVPLGEAAGDAVAVAVAYSRGGGLQLANSDGSTRWTAVGARNLWRVAAGRMRRGGGESIVCAGMAALIEIYDGMGHQTAQIQTSASMDQQMVARLITADLDGDGVDEIVTVGRKLFGGAAVVTARSASGAQRWETPIGPASVQYVPGLTAGSFLGKGVQLAASSEDGAIALLDAHGKVLGRQAVGARVVGLATLRGAPGRPDRLVAATADGCRCLAWRGAAR